jgi:hypothetical protein
VFPDKISLTGRTVRGSFEIFLRGLAGAIRLICEKTGLPASGQSKS